MLNLATLTIVELPPQYQQESEFAIQVDESKGGFAAEQDFADIDGADSDERMSEMCGDV